MTKSSNVTKDTVFLDDVLKTVSYEQKLAVTSFVFDNIWQHALEGGSFRYLIYERLGFNPDAYVPLYHSNGLNISNELSILDETHDDSVEKLMTELTKLANNSPLDAHPSAKDYKGDPVKVPSHERLVLRGAVSLMTNMIGQIKRDQAVKDCLKKEIDELIQDVGRLSTK